MLHYMDQSIATTDDYTNKDFNSIASKYINKYGVGSHVCTDNANSGCKLQYQLAEEHIKYLYGIKWQKQQN